MRIALLLARRDPVVHLLTPDQSVLEAVSVMTAREVGAVLVADGGRLVGILSEQDVIRRVLGQGRSVEGTFLEQVMTGSPVTTQPDEEVGEARAKMQRLHCRHLPVLVGGQPADMLSMRDLLRMELAEREHEVEHLQSYIRGDAPE